MKNKQSKINNNLEQSMGVLANPSHRIGQGWTKTPFGQKRSVFRFEDFTISYKYFRAFEMLRVF